MTTKDRDDTEGRDPTDGRDATVYKFTPPPPPPAAPGSDREPPGPATMASGPEQGASSTAGGLPAKPRRGRSQVTKTAAGLALVLGAGAGGAGIALATAPGGAPALASSSAATSTTTPQPSRSGRGPLSGVRAGMLPGRFEFLFGGGRFGFAGVGSPGVVHGSYTVKGPSGSYETLDTQVGTVQSVSSTSITVKSADGYSKQYAVNSKTVVYAEYNGIGSVKVGDNVVIVGLVGSSGVTAEQVIDTTQVQANRSGWMPSPPTGPTTAPAGGSTAGNLNGDGPFGGYDGPGSAA